MREQVQVIGSDVVCIGHDSSISKLWILGAVYSNYHNDRFANPSFIATSL